MFSMFNFNPEEPRLADFFRSAIGRSRLLVAASPTRPFCGHRSAVRRREASFDCRTMNPRGETTLRGTKIVNLRAYMALAAGESGFALSLGSHASELLL